MWTARGGRLGSQPPPLAEQIGLDFLVLHRLQWYRTSVHPYWVGQGGVRDGEFIFIPGGSLAGATVGGIPVAAEPSARNTTSA